MTIFPLYKAKEQNWKVTHFNWRQILRERERETRHIQT